MDERWKSAEHFTEILTVQAKELEDMLNKIFHSANPAARMKELAENLNKAMGGDSKVMEKCYFVFEALTNDKNMREILRGTKDDFENFTNVI